MLFHRLLSSCFYHAAILRPLCQVPTELLGQPSLSLCFPGRPLDQLEQLICCQYFVAGVLFTSPSVGEVSTSGYDLTRVIHVLNFGEDEEPAIYSVGMPFET